MDGGVKERERLEAWWKDEKNPPPEAECSRAESAVTASHLSNQCQIGIVLQASW